MTRTPSGLSSVTTVAVPNSEQDKSVAFYTETLGCQTTRDMAFGPGMRWVEVSLPGGTTTIAIPPTPPTTQIGVDTGIRLSCEDAEATHRYLNENGVDTDSEVLNFGPGVPPMFSFRDIDGNTLYVVQG